jgi:CRISPR-associated exonuclease Cas4
MHITGTHFNYYLICHRKLWLFANGINMEPNSDLVTEGRLLHEHSYKQRSDRYKEVEIGGIKLDYYDAKNKVVHEIKKSDKLEAAHILQLKYYLFVLEENGVEGVSGKLEYPKLRKTDDVWLTDSDRELMQTYRAEIDEIIHGKTAPGRIKASICKRCSYYDFCYSQEPE